MPLIGIASSRKLSEPSRFVKPTPTRTQIDLPWPRRYTDPKFLELRKMIADNSDLAL